MNDKTTGPTTGCLALNRPPASALRTIYLAAGFTLGWVLFAVGCAMLMALAGWLRWREVHPKQHVRRLRQAASRLCRWYLQYHTRMHIISVEYRHTRELGPGLIVANHPSLVDALWLLATQPNVCCVLKSDLQRSPLLRYLVQSLDYVSNHDPEQLLAEGCQRLQAGETLLVFPEATRTAPGRLPEFRLGAAELLVRSGATLYPVIIFKAGAYLSKSRAWHEFPKRPEHWLIEFDPPLAPDCSGDPRQARRRITSQLQLYFHQRLSADTEAAAVARTGEPAEN